MTTQAQIEAIIKTAKLGRSRRDAQQDTCAVFAAALYDLLEELDVCCSLHVATDAHKYTEKWYHCVVRVDGQYYDSLGEFSQEIWRKRMKTHPKVPVTITYSPDSRMCCYDEEFDEMHAFYLKELRKASKKLARATDAQAA